MKSSLALTILLGLAACEKTDDLARRRAEVTTIAAYYGPVLDGFEKRMRAILERSRTLDQSAPGIGDVGVKFAAARDRLGKLRGLVAASGAGKSPIETSADTAAKTGNADEVAAIADHAREQLADGATTINGQLVTVEAWIAQLDQRPKVIAQTPPPPPPPPAPAPAPEPARP